MECLVPGAISFHEHGLFCHLRIILSFLIPFFGTCKQPPTMDRLALYILAESRSTLQLPTIRWYVENNTCNYLKYLKLLRFGSSPFATPLHVALIHLTLLLLTLFQASRKNPCPEGNRRKERNSFPEASNGVRRSSVKCIGAKCTLRTLFR